MKKIILSCSLFFALFSASAQSNTGMSPSTNVQTPSTVTTRFSNDYPGMDATWSMDGSNYRADYTDGAINRSVIYDQKGKMLSREEQMRSNTYPSSIGDYYTKNYPNEKYDVWSSTDPDGTTTYYTKRNSETIWFDKSGKYKSTTKTKNVKK